MSNRKANYAPNKLLIQLAKDRPCMDCGIQKAPPVMTFDHRDRSTKKFKIANAANKKSPTAIMREIEKCDVVCRPCHNNREFLRDHDLGI